MKFCVLKAERKSRGDYGGEGAGACFRCSKPSWHSLRLVLSHTPGGVREDIGREFAAYLRKQSCSDVRTSGPPPYANYVYPSVKLYACQTLTCEAGLKALGDFLRWFGAPHPLLRRVGTRGACISDATRQTLADAASAEWKLATAGELRCSRCGTPIRGGECWPCPCGGSDVL